MLQGFQVFTANTSGPTATDFTFSVPGIACQCVTSEQLRSEQDREADAIRRDKTISRKERRKRLSLLRKGKR